MSAANPKHGPAGCLLILASLAATLLLRPFVVVTLYGWFAVPADLPVVPWWSLVGLLYLFGLVRATQADPRGRESRELTAEEERQLAANRIGQPLLVLALGWAVLWLGAPAAPTPIAAPVPCSAPSRGPVGVLPEGS